MATLESITSAWLSVHTPSLHVTQPKFSWIALLIDEEPQSRRLLRVKLRESGYRVFEAATGQEGILQTAQRRPDVILLDPHLPDLDGLEVLKRIRQWSRVPVLILSVRDGTEDKIAALDSGADDYMTKPFDISELLARVRVALRHIESQATALTRYGRLEVDFALRLVRKDGREIKLTPTEYSLLHLFVTHAGKVLTHPQILTAVWGPHAIKQTHYLRVYVTHLRNKIEHNRASPEMLITESGVGYRFIGCRDQPITNLQRPTFQLSTSAFPPAGEPGTCQIAV